MLASSDQTQLQEQGISEQLLEQQIGRFKKGFEPLELAAAATASNGIMRLSDDDIEAFISLYEAADVDTLKFVPASGAASRMFKGLFGLLELDDSSYLKDEITLQFFSQIKNFAFFDDLKAKFEQNTQSSFDEAIDRKDREVVATLLNEAGLDYGSLPKGLLRFHRYEDDVRTPVQEHISEGLSYASKGDTVNIHFTVSPDHQEKFEKHVSDVVAKLAGDIKIDISYSTQKNSTDTVAVDLENNPFRDDQGKLLFRPAGHGALLENLNQLDADIVFVKNIDNVVPDRIKGETIRYKKVLAGILLKYQQMAFDLLSRAEKGEGIKKEGTELLAQMGLKGAFSNADVIEKLNRPIRVCGMVKNEGEPGGGPFWVHHNGNETLQIVESAQVNTEDATQKNIFVEATHFNPVDLVCGLRGANGNPFDLLTFRDNDTGFITEKSYQGRKLKAMELPGLWNGSMAHWNTIFVEVPLITFNPVKTVMDLLKPNHQ